MIMKKLLLYLASIVFLTNASMHAMGDNDEAKKNDDVRIVAYDIEKHGRAMQKLFWDTFEYNDDALIYPANNPNMLIDIVVKNQVPLGFAIYEYETLSYRQTFSDLPQYQKSDTTLNVLRLHYLVIRKDHRTSPERRGSGLGSRLLCHLKKVACDKKQDVIALDAAYDSRPFYEKYGFIKTLPETIPNNCMALPLNETIDQIIRAVKNLRTEFRQQGKGLRYQRYLV